jgi:DNA-binding XRE family transcriptional regulator
MQYEINGEWEMRMLGVDLCHIRMSKNISKKHAALKCNLNLFTINKIEKGEYVSFEKLLVYCEMIGYKITLEITEK